MNLLENLREKFKGLEPSPEIESPKLNLGKFLEKEEHHSHRGAGERTPAQRAALRKAQRTWDKMHPESRAEGGIPQKYYSGGETYRYVDDYSTEKEANKKARKLRKQGWKVRTDELEIAGEIKHIVYKGSRRKNKVREKNKRWYR